MKLEAFALSCLILATGAYASNSTKNAVAHPATDSKQPIPPYDKSATTAAAADYASQTSTENSKTAHLRKFASNENLVDHLSEYASFDSAVNIPLEYIVTLDPEYSHEHFDRFMGEQLADAGAYELLHRYSEVMHGVTVRGVSEEDIRKHPGVIKIEANKIVTPPRSETSGKVYTSFIRSWGLDRINQPYLPLDSTFIPTYNGRGVDIYILDSGIDTTHVDFFGSGRTVQNLWAAPGLSLSANNDDNGHGTHVAATAGGNTVGVSRLANLFGVKVLNNLNQGTVAWILAGLDQVAIRHRAVAGRRSVVNMSLGVDCGGGCLISESVVAATNALVAKGVVVVAAAGNSNRNACTVSPAAAASAITVAASTRTDNEWASSNWGSCVDLFAPGAEIVSACASSECPGTASFSSKTGTSMAAPHVAGVAAQILEMLPGANPTTVAAALNCMARKDVMKGVTVGTKSALLQQVSPGDHCVQGAVTKFEIVTQFSSSWCVDISGWNAPANGKVVQLWGCNDSGAQRFDYYSSTKEFKLSAFPTYCLEIPNSDLTNGVKLRLWTCNGGANQKFGIFLGEIYSYINFDKCVDVTGQSFVSGTRLQIKDCNRSPAQLWFFNKF